MINVRDAIYNSFPFAANSVRWRLHIRTAIALFGGSIHHLPLFHLFGVITPDRLQRVNEPVHLTQEEVAAAVSGPRHA